MSEEVWAAAGLDVQLHTVYQVIIEEKESARLISLAAHFLQVAFFNESARRVQR